MNPLCLLLGHRWRWMRCERCGTWRTTPSAVAKPKPTRRVHALKCWPQYYRAVAAGEKTFELRQNDRDFRTGDHLILSAWDPMEQRYLGPRTTCQITYVLPGGSFGLSEGWCILAIKPLHSTSGASHIQIIPNQQA